MNLLLLLILRPQHSALRTVFKRICLLLSVTLLISGLPLATNAQTYNPPRRGKPATEGGGTRGGQQQPVRFSIPDRGLPGRREDGGTRGPANCISGDPAILALLLPSTNLGLTTAGYPRFFWYTPETTARRAQFSLYKLESRSRQRNLVYNTTFNITGKPGVASLALPSDATIPPLEINQDYQWSVSIICNPEDRFPRPVVSVDGWVQRVALDSDAVEQLQQLSVSDRIRFYAQRGLWFDMLTTLAELRACNPSDTDLLDTWASILKSVNLQFLAEKPVLQQCPNPELGE